jgi:TetR/AcrR family transcriptional regulator
MNHQLITYYFGGKEGSYREIGRLWRDHERRAYPDSLSFPDVTRRIVSTRPAALMATICWPGKD